MSKPQVVFFGTGPVAAKSLELLSEWAEVEAVITKPKPAHHKASFPVLELAEKLGLKVLPVTDKKSLSELLATRPVTSQVGILIDFGIIVSQDVIDYFPLGIINSHFSLLPEWRGADPITFSILSGQAETGVSEMLLVAGMDEGPLLAQAAYELSPDITTPQLTEDLIDLSNRQLEHILPLYIEGVIQAVPQEQVAQPGHQEVTYSRKLSKGDGNLDFSKPAADLEREVRAFAEWPKSRTAIGDKAVAITKAHVIDGNGKPGEIWREGKEFGFYTSDGIFVVDTLRPAGKGEMPVAAFLAGYQL
jgi:methionyl-tRNA formyltransferase